MMQYHFNARRFASRGILGAAMRVSNDDNIIFGFGLATLAAGTSKGKFSILMTPMVDDPNIAIALRSSEF